MEQFTEWLYYSLFYQSDLSLSKNREAILTQSSHAEEGIKSVLFIRAFGRAGKRCVYRCTTMRRSLLRSPAVCLQII